MCPFGSKWKLWFSLTWGRKAFHIHFCIFGNHSPTLFILLLFNPEIFFSEFLTRWGKSHLLRWQINFSGRVWDLRSSSLRERLLLVPLSSGPGVFEDPVRIKVIPTPKLSSIPVNTSKSLAEIQPTVNFFPWNGSEAHKTSNFLKYKEIKSAWSFLFLFFPSRFSPSHTQSI